MISIFEGVLRLSASAVPVILAVAAVRLLLNFAPRKYSYALWGVVAFRLCIPFSFKSPFSLLGVIKSLPKLFSGNSSTAYVPVTPPMESAVVTLPEAAAPSFTLPVTGSVSTAPSVVAPAVPEQSFADILPSLASAVWVLGVIAFLVYGITTYMRVKRLTSDAVHMGGGVYESGRVTSPFVLGVIRPRIYIPESLDSATRELVVSHERFHIRRCDHVIKLLAYVILSLHWFNPLCYLAFALMSRDMEMSCDEKVLASVKKDETYDIRKEYSMAILKTASEKKSIPGPVAFGGISVKNRVVHALNFKKPRFWVSVLSVIICAVTLLGCAANAPTNDNNETNTPNTEGIPEVSEITPLDDAVTRVLLEEEPLSSNERYYSCRSHAILKTYENSEDGTVSLLVLMGTPVDFDTVTGEILSYSNDPSMVLIKLQKADDSYEKLSCFDLNMSLEEMLEEFGRVIENEEALKEYFPNEDIDALNTYISDVEHGKYFGKIEYTPRRYEKDGKLFELDNAQRSRYFISLVDEVLRSDKNYDDPEDYIRENSEAFKKVMDQRDVYELLIDEFLKGGNDDLRGYVMYRALEEYLKSDAHAGLYKDTAPFEFDPVDENGKKNGQLYFDALLEEALRDYAEYGNVGMNFVMRERSRLEICERYFKTLTDSEYADLDHLYDLPEEIAVNYNGERVVLDKGTDDYYAVFRATSMMFLNTEKGYTNKFKYYGTVDSPNDDEVKKLYVDKEYYYDSPYAEFIYENGKTELIIGCSGDMTLKLREDGKYDLYYDLHYMNGITSISWNDIIEKY